MSEGRVVQALSSEMAEGAIYKALSDVMADVGIITKDQTNEFDHYKFRGIDDVYNALQPALVKNGVLVIPTVSNLSMDTYETAKGAVMQRAILTMEYRFIAQDGSSITATVVGEGADRGDKAINKAHSSAYKNAIFQALCIPTESGKSDSERESPDPESAESAAARAAVKEENKQVTPRSAIGKMLLATMRKRCAEVGVSPDDCAVGAIKSILGKLGVEKTAAELTKHSEKIVNHIKVWQPPGEDFPPDPASDFGADPTLGESSQDMRSLHKWAKDELGLEAKEAHVLIHDALPVGVKSTSDLKVSQLGELKRKAREIIEKERTDPATASEPPDDRRGREG